MSLECREPLWGCGVNVSFLSALYPSNGPREIKTSQSGPIHKTISEANRSCTLHVGGTVGQCQQLRLCLSADSRMGTKVLIYFAEIKRLRCFSNAPPPQGFQGCTVTCVHPFQSRRPSTWSHRRGKARKQLHLSSPSLFSLSLLPLSTLSCMRLRRRQRRGPGRDWQMRPCRHPCAQTQRCGRQRRRRRPAEGLG